MDARFQKIAHLREGHDDETCEEVSDAVNFHPFKIGRDDCATMFV